MDRPEYHAEFRNRWDTLSVDVLDDWHGEGNRHMVRLSSEIAEEERLPESITDLSPDCARRLAHHLLNAAGVAERADDRPRILTGEHWRIALVIEDALPYTDPCDTTTCRLVSGRKEKDGHWEHVFDLPEEQFDEPQSLMTQAGELLKQRKQRT
jgi:hypothetical protein